MSYNISNWKTKKLENLIIPLVALEYSEDYQRRGWVIRKNVQVENGKLIARVGMADTDEAIMGEIEDIDDPKIKVSKISLRGEGSGTDYNEVLLEALKHSTGILDAVLIWEGGDSVSGLSVENGIVTESEIEL